MPNSSKVIWTGYFLNQVFLDRPGVPQELVTDTGRIYTPTSDYVTIDLGTEKTLGPGDYILRHASLVYTSGSIGFADFTWKLILSSSGKKKEQSPGAE